MATNLGDNERCRKLEKVWENALALHDNQAKALKVQHDFRAHCQQMLKDFDTKGDGSSEQRSQLQDSVDKAEKSVKEAQESVKEAQKSVDNALAEWKEAMDLVRAQANVSSATESVIIAKPAASERQDSQDPGQDPGQESYASESVRQSPVHQPLTTWQSKITTATNIAEFLMRSDSLLVVIGFTSAWKTLLLNWCPEIIQDASRWLCLVKGAFEGAKQLKQKYVAWKREQQAAMSDRSR